MDLLDWVAISAVVDTQDGIEPRRFTDQALGCDGVVLCQRGILSTSQAQEGQAYAE